MISMKELLMGRQTEADLTPEQRANSAILLKRINLLRAAYGKPLKVNDGIRRQKDQPKNAAVKSKHLIGAAIDLDDDDAGTVWKWVFENRAKLVEWGLWMEHPCWTHCNGMSWLHFQIIPPSSGKRFFIPSATPNPNPTFWDSKYERELDGLEQPQE